MPKSRTLGIADCAERYRTAMAELEYARGELEAAIAGCGWYELQRHQPAGGELSVIYQRDVPQTDPVSGMAGTSAEIASFDSFARGEIS